MQEEEKGKKKDAKKKDKKEKKKEEKKTKKGKAKKDVGCITYFNFESDLFADFFYLCIAIHSTDITTRDVVGC